MALSHNMQLDRFAMCFERMNRSQFRRSRKATGVDLSVVSITQKHTGANWSAACIYVVQTPLEIEFKPHTVRPNVHRRVSRSLLGTAPLTWSEPSGWTVVVSVGNAERFLPVRPARLRPKHPLSPSQ
ncbi:MAG: hypothetical protein ACI80I_002858 [Akkermansiaceae bacterium]|jgi:hypothetical protein